MGVVPSSIEVTPLPLASLLPERGNLATVLVGVNFPVDIFGAGGIMFSYGLRVSYGGGRHA